MKHGTIVVAQHHFRLVDRPDRFGGYVADPQGDSLSFERGHQPCDPDLRVSVDVGGISNHQQLRLIGSLSSGHMRIDPDELFWVPVEDNWWSLRYGGVEFFRIFMFAHPEPGRSDDDLRREAAMLLAMRLKDMSNHQRMELRLAADRARRVRAMQAAVDYGFASGVSPSSTDEIRAEARRRYEALAVSPAAPKRIGGAEVGPEAPQEDDDYGHE